MIVTAKNDIGVLIKPDHVKGEIKAEAKLVCRKVLIEVSARFDPYHRPSAIAAKNLPVQMHETQDAQRQHQH